MSLETETAWNTKTRPLLWSCLRRNLCGLIGLLPPQELHVLCRQQHYIFTSCEQSSPGIGAASRKSED